MQIMAKLDFCVSCGCWIAADTGTMRVGVDGEAEIICDSCEALEQARAVAMPHDHKSGTL